MKPIQTYVIGDLHFGHRRITEFRPQFETMEQHEAHVMACWRSVVRERDKVWVLGDAAFSLEGLLKLGELPGTKFLVRGNHDELSTMQYLTVFAEVYGIVKYKRRGRRAVWLSHAPIHPDELRGRMSFHGHVHNNTVLCPVTGLPDPRYVNLCPEAIGYAPILLHPLLPASAEEFCS